jgi:hypothetical protein
MKLLDPRGASSETRSVADVTEMGGTTRYTRLTTSAKGAELTTREGADP